MFPLLNKKYPRIAPVSKFSHGNENFNRNSANIIVLLMTLSRPFQLQPITSDERPEDKKTYKTVILYLLLVISKFKHKAVSYTPSKNSASFLVFVSMSLANDFESRSIGWSPFFTRTYKVQISNLPAENKQ